MRPADPVRPAAAPPVSPTAAQQRVIAAAIDLFGRHGVGGTSLQMIADELGVTKAAVYHRYRTRDEIIVAAAEAELRRLTVVVDAAEAEPSRKRARDRLITGIVDLAVDRGPTVRVLLNDPVIGEIFAGYEPFREVMNRMRHLLLGDDAGSETIVRTVMLVAAISGTVMHPLVVAVDDETLRSELRRLARRFLGGS